jgi:hypothetical protein
MEAIEPIPCRQVLEEKEEEFSSCTGARREMVSTIDARDPSLSRPCPCCRLLSAIDEGMTPRSSIFAYPVPAKEEARSKDT